MLMYGRHGACHGGDVFNLCAFHSANSSHDYCDEVSCTPITGEIICLTNLLKPTWIWLCLIIIFSKGANATSS